MSDIPENSPHNEKSSAFNAIPLDANIQEIEEFKGKADVVFFRFLGTFTVVYFMVPTYFVFYSLFEGLRLSRFIPHISQGFVSVVFVDVIRISTNGIISLFFTILLVRWTVRIVCKIDRFLCRK